VGDDAAGRRWFAYCTAAGTLATVGVLVGLEVAQGFSASDLALSLIPFLVPLSLAVYLRFGYRSPLEKAWQSYLNDKNVSTSDVQLAPVLSVGPRGGVAGLAVRF
jgi:hypothetical protein